MSSFMQNPFVSPLLLAPYFLYMTPCLHMIQGTLSKSYTVCYIVYYSFLHDGAALLLFVACKELLGVVSVMSF